MAEEGKMEVTAEEFKGWIEHGITQKLMKDIIHMSESLKNYLAAGSTISKDAELTTDRIVGRIEGLTELFRLFEDTKEETKEVPEYGH
jgi:hypothetical protein